MQLPREAQTSRGDAGRRCPRVGIVVLSWNRCRETVECLRSLERTEYPAFDVVVVDNGSTDGSPEAVRRAYPGATLIASDRNLGFAAGNNVGIARALDLGADYVLLLNDDTEVAPEMLDALVAAAAADPRIGVVGPRIYYFAEKAVIWSAGGLIDRLGRPRHRRVGEADDGAAEPPRDVDYVTGCAMLVRREVVERVGGLDERFFAYFEETEWCARARRAGFRVVYTPRARLWHKISPTARASSSTYLYLMTRNRLLYLSSIGSSPWVLGLACLDILRTAASWWIRPRYRSKRPGAGALLRGLGDFARGRFGAVEIK